MKKASVVALRCPNCGNRVHYEQGLPLPPGFPFCSPRCKMVDFHNWMNEEYVLERDLTPVEYRRYAEQDEDEGRDL